MAGRANAEPSERGWQRGPMGCERDRACGAAFSRRIGCWARTPTLHEARLANVAGWVGFKAGDFFRRNGIWQKRLVWEGRNGGWGSFCNGLWVERETILNRQDGSAGRTSQGHQGIQRRYMVGMDRGRERHVLEVSQSGRIGFQPSTRPGRNA